MALSGSVDGALLGEMVWTVELFLLCGAPTSNATEGSLGYLFESSSARLAPGDRVWSESFRELGGNRISVRGGLMRGRDPQNRKEFCSVVTIVDSSLQEIVCVCVCVCVCLCGVCVYVCVHVCVCVCVCVWCVCVCVSVWCVHVCVWEGAVANQPLPYLQDLSQGQE